MKIIFIIQNHFLRLAIKSNIIPLLVLTTYTLISFHPVNKPHIAMFSLCAFYLHFKMVKGEFKNYPYAFCSICACH